MALEDTVKSLTTITHAFQNEPRASIKNLEQRISQLSTSVGCLESQGKLPGHIDNNMKHNMSTISLRSENFYKGQSGPDTKKEEAEEVIEEISGETNV